MANYITFQPHDYFNSVLWAGNGSAGRDITGVGFQPDWVWIKNRSRSSNHTIVDASRNSGTYPLSSSTSAVEDTDTNQVSALIADGFTVGSSTNTNANGENLVGWNWRAGTTTGLSGGDITPSSYSYNATAGFGVYNYNGNSTDNQTITHGLGAAPNAVIFKSRTNTESWRYHTNNGGNTSQMFTHRLILNDTSANTSQTDGVKAVSSTTITIGNGGAYNTSGQSYVMYLFVEKRGFSKFGIYTGNGVTDGAFIYTGFKPAWLMVKEHSQSGESWIMFDNKRSAFNLTDDVLFANANQQEEADQTSKGIDFLSNGFKIRSSDSVLNDGETYQYLAFAEEPIVASNADPATAR